MPRRVRPTPVTTAELGRRDRFGWCLASRAATSATPTRRRGRVALFGGWPNTATRRAAGPGTDDTGAMAGDGVLHHFSEDPTITRFVPHVPATNPDHRPAVWTIDTEHAPLYWFPRDFPRVTVWPRGRGGRTHFASWFVTTADRL